MFYYIQRCYEPIIKEFIPRIPESRMEGENAKIPRICLAKTIEGCINAAPWGYSQISYRNLNEVFRLYSFDESKIPVNNIWDTRTIYNCGYVDDAKYTKEVWVLNQNLIPDSIEYFQIGENFEEETVDIIPYQDIRTKTYSETSYFRIIKDIELKFLNNCELFQGRELHLEFNIPEYKLDDVLPIEVFYDYKDDEKTIIFSEPVVIRLKDLDSLLG